MGRAAYGLRCLLMRLQIRMASKERAKMDQDVNLSHNGKEKVMAKRNAIVANKTPQVPHHL